MATTTRHTLTRVLVLLALCLLPLASQGQYFKIKTASIKFDSNAPLEVIKAASTELKGLINPEKNTFAFTVPMVSFQGFNSALQRTHFNEGYMESAKFPYGVFKGKFIETIDFTKNGTYQARAKGELDIHGVKVERIIVGTIVVNNGEVKINAVFKVPLKDHRINIPTVVNQKIAEQIEVTIVASFVKS